MKVRVKSPFYDSDGLHCIDDVIEVKYFDPNTMEEVKKEEKKAEKAEEKAEPKKATAKKKG